MTPIKSFLFVPADSDKKLGKCMTAGAEAIILDLEDSVALENKGIARQKALEFLQNHLYENRPSQIWVRINPLYTQEALLDLTAIMSGMPNGIMLPKADGPQTALQLSHYLNAFEASSGIDIGQTLILPIATETAISPFTLGDYAHTNLARLYGLTWGAEDLSTALGASTNLGTDGKLTHTYQTVRSLCLMAAHAAGVHPVEAVYTDFRDDTGLRTSSIQARSEGFSGRMAIHPVQVSAINESFTPSDPEIAYAKTVIAAFEKSPNAGVASLEGKMLDIPHLKQAHRVLSQVSG